MEKHVAFQMTPRLPDLDNFRPFMLDYMKHSLRGIRTGIAQTKPELRKKGGSWKRTRTSFCSYLPTTANMDMKLI